MLKVGCKRTLKMSFAVLPTDLQDLVCKFAFGTCLNTVKCDLNILFEIKAWKLPDIFIRECVYCVVLGYHVPNPLKMYSPLANFHSVQCIFDHYPFGCVIDKLDFRKKAVKQWGTRWQWKIYIGDWEFYGLFAAFYREMNKDVAAVVRPQWKEARNLCGFSFSRI